MFSGVERTLDLNITQSMLDDWKSGTLIQTAMPQLSTDEREFIMTGVTAEEWSNEFGGDEDDQIHDRKGFAGDQDQLLSDDDLENLMKEYDQ